MENLKEKIEGAIIGSSFTNRVFMIKYGEAIGTSFVIDVDNKQYFVTAKHVISKAKENDLIGIYSNGIFKDYTLHLIGHHDIADISVFSINFRSPNITKRNIQCIGEPVYGQDMAFLGFPFAMTQDEVAKIVNNGYPLPFLKRATMSAIMQEGDEKIFMLDGINNPGFSGGPVIYYNIKLKENCIGAVISGYKQQHDEIVDSKGKVISGVASLGNAGLIRSWSIKYAIDLINQNPTGYNY